jgi:hypothetical protein
MSDDVIAKSTSARTPEMPSLKDPRDKLRLIFQALDVFSMAGPKTQGSHVPLWMMCVTDL